MPECDNYEKNETYAMKGDSKVSEDVTQYQFKEKPSPDSVTINKKDAVTVSKKAFRHFPLFPNKRGVITVEASLILPMVILICFSLLVFFQILTVQIKLQSALEEAAKQLSVATFFEGFISSDGESEDGGLADLVKSYAAKYVLTEITAEYVKEFVMDRVGSEWLDSTLIKGGSKGLDFSISLISKESSLIDLRVEYCYSLPVLPDSLVNLEFSQRSVRRIWTGRQIVKNSKNDNNMEVTENESQGNESDGEGEDEEKVYITKTGKVYHIFRDCSSLKRSVKTGAYSNMTDKRNDNGGKYYACENCVRGDANLVVYYTADGDRYHNSRTCGSLMRYIQEISISEINGRPLCKFCLKRQNSIDAEALGEAA